ncbi:cytosolic phospholipase A2 gamma-like [Sinocyclocheilus rhinocerous]|uniref:cytosolic phospholipase A2 gamma-like n=1 Tax=Sinocyclocheilus rhinocerous TaxID=307959 RepID=UPI0007B84E81|nr:PREDICTED: cytosolic phospholipase A2 gamma-like [Sinocyclocheilus rhinocerous]
MTLILSLKLCVFQDKVPHFALLGSGGGQRAMVGLLGSLVQLDKAGLLDCILYLSGVSGSTWCMASLYQEPDWSTKLETMKNKIIKRLSGPKVSWGDAFAKLKKYYYEKDIFSLTDVWAVLVVTEYVKEIDENTLTEKQNQHSEDPFPIYTVIDKQYKQSKDEKDSWFEISPHEAGYSLTGAFVGTSSFGSQFDKGSKKKPQPETDMLYLQALCGSALADGEEIKKFLWQKIKDFFKHLFPIMQSEMFDEMRKAPPAEKGYQVLMDLVDMNLAVLNGKEPSAFEQSIRTTLNDETVPHTLLKSEKRDYEDAGLLLNSPYFSMLREERNIDLIISLDFSEGDPFMTVREAADMCKKLKIPFPEVNIPSEDVEKPKDFYVFKGKNAPTVIHIPLFNVVNCGDNIEAWWNNYGTFQDSYSAEMITDLMDVAGKNISNNREKLKEQIQAVIEQKLHK